MRRLISYFSRKQNQAVDGVDVIRQHFDAQFYVSAYPDVADSSIDPAEHYFVVGWRHGRDPCAWFSTEEYLKANGDVAEADVNPFYHYLTHGREEGRVVVASRLSDSRGGAASHSAGTESSRRPPEGAPGMSEDVLAQQRSVVAGAFDTNFYRSTYPDLHPLNDDQLVDHFNEHGWREHRDPCPWFSTNYYLKRYPDIGRSSINPLYHYLAYGQREGRLPDYYHRHKRSSAARPRVSAIIPNFNHARFLEERIQSIVAQEWLPEEIIILDDASTDDSREVLERIAKTIDIPVKIVLNDENSGNVFRQWEKGVSMASAEVLWICESDDFCDRKFLSTLAPYFCDPSIMIAFGAIQFASADGAPLAGLDEYRESAARGFWNEPRVESAPEWFKGPFGLRNVIANVGGCLIRRQTIEKSIWTEAQSYRVCGDWFLYMHLAHGGRIAFDPRAIAFFRQHAKNTSVSSFRSLSFYEEHFRIALELQRMYGVSDANICRFYRIVRTQFLKALGDEPGSNLDAVFCLNTLINQERVCPHILIMILGFLTGGGEIFPINLANALAERGYAVSVMPLMTAGENEEIRGRLDSRIAIYERNLIDEIGFDRFLESQQIDLVHTHYIAADIDYHKAIRARRLPYVVTHHGSYEVTEVDSATLMSIMSAVQHWVYISDKNLEKLEALGLNRAATTKLPNAVPLRHATFPYTRQSLGIEENAFVFGVASRAILPKGWDIAAKALEKVRAENHRPVYVVFCGEGPDYEELYNAHNEKEGIIFLGYQREIMAFYEMCDCALLPTRFQGESYPLTIIEAIIKNIPVIATDIGELKHMIKPDDIAAGVLVPNIEDDDVFIAEVAAAMNKMLNVHEHARYVRGARKIAKLYDFNHLVTQYEKVYKVAGLKGSRRMKSRLTIHAGVNKTGSSAIQHFLRNNVEQLSSEGVVVPNLSMEIQPPVEGHHVWYFHERRGAPREIAKHETTQKIRDLMTHPGVKQVIVSAENLGSVDNDYAFWFIDIAKEFEDVEVIMYLRRQDDLLLSSWQQWHVKTGEDLWSWIASCLGGLGNWRRVVERWEAVLGRHRVRLRLFERNRLKNGDVVDDFCQFILGDHSAFVNDRSVAVNPSYNEAIVDLVAGGGFFKDAHDNEFYKFLEHYLDDASHRRSRESLLTIDQRLAIIARYAASNSWVREHYFASSDTPETLFALPRASDYDVVTSEDLRKEQVQMLARVLFEMHKRGKK